MSSITPFQPTLPAEGNFTDAEIAFLEDSPPGIFPENQNSNFGLIIRKGFSDFVQDLIGQQQTLYNEMFVTTALQFLDQWEKQVNLPQNPTNLTTSQRRQVVLARLSKGPFTWARRAAIMDNFVRSSFGASTAFIPEGIPFDVAGIPLFAGVSSSIGAYRIYEDVRNYSYSVWLSSAFTPGPGLTRELTRITPAGISFTIDNSKTSVLAYQYLMGNAHPIGYWRMGSLADISGNAATLTAAGGVVAGNMAAPGLLVPHAWGGSEGATDLDGVDDAFSFTLPAAAIPKNAFSFEAWVRPDAISGTYNMAITSSGQPDYLGMNGGVPIFSIYTNGAQQTILGISALTVGSTYHLVGTFSGTEMRLYVNGVMVKNLLLTSAQQGTLLFGTTGFIGRLAGGSPYYWNGVIDEAAIYDYALSPATILDHYNTGKNIATY